MVCDRHDEVIEQLDDHEDRIKYLELADTETKAELKNLIVTVKELITELKEEKKERHEEKAQRMKDLEEQNKFLFRSIIGAGGTLLVILITWYIQTH